MCQAFAPGPPARRPACASGSSGPVTSLTWPWQVCTALPVRRTSGGRSLSTEDCLCPSVLNLFFFNAGLSFSLYAPGEHDDGEPLRCHRGSWVDSTKRR